MDRKLTQTLLRLISRKFLVVVGMLISSHWLMNYGHISDNVYMYIILGTVAAYITGNVTQNIKLAAIPSETVTVGNVSSTIAGTVNSIAAANTFTEEDLAALTNAIAKLRTTPVGTPRP